MGSRTLKASSPPRAAVRSGAEDDCGNTVGTVADGRAQCQPAFTRGVYALRRINARSHKDHAQLAASSDAGRSAGSTGSAPPEPTAPTEPFAPTEPSAPTEPLNLPVPATQVRSAARGEWDDIIIQPPVPEPPKEAYGKEGERGKGCEARRRTCPPKRNRCQARRRKMLRSRGFTERSSAAGVRLTTRRSAR